MLSSTIEADAGNYFFSSLLADIRTFARHLESWVLAATVELPDYLKMGKIQGEFAQESRTVFIYSLLSWETFLGCVESIDIYRHFFWSKN